LARLARIADGNSLRGALGMLDAARREARTARARTFGVPHPTGWAASLAAGLAGREAAWACAGAAAWAAARVSIGDTAGDRARAASRATAGDAAAIAVRQSRLAARHGGAREAARTVLAPTLDSLTDSALDLLDRMLPTEVIELPQPAPPRAVRTVA
jgi:hypothetical protein